MKKSLKILLFISIGFLVLLLCSISYCFFVSLGTNLNKEKLINLDVGITYLDTFGNVIEEESGSTSITEIKDIPAHVKNAFISIEDKRFYKHNGIDVKGMLRASISNLKSLSFKEGASTISQQLVKNTHLSSEKTIKRKILEIKLTRQLEKSYTKDEILEKYLNTIYFGENCYGITSASKKYFNKKPSNLTISESAVLAGIIKAPSNFSPYKNHEKCLERRNLVLKKMLENEYINNTEYENAVSSKIETYENNQNKKYDFLYLAKNDAEKILSGKPLYKYQKITVETTFNPKIQKSVENSITNDEYDKTLIVSNKNNDILAYFSTIGEVRRCIGSTIKPLLVYAPAIEENCVYSCSKILDEKTNFNGYSPSNYNEKYYGNVSVKNSLAKSLNVCAVKLLNYTGIENSLKYLNKTYIKTTENDKNLAIALGATENGATMRELAGSYNLFQNDGNLISQTCIKNIKINNKTVYKNNKESEKIFSPDTTYIINDMMRETTLNGTGKKLSFANAKVYSKTGTVGNKNGNTDAYSISFNPEYLIGVWYGGDKFILPNSITGGTTPAIISTKIWNELYKNKCDVDFYMPDEIKILDVDKTEYEKDNVILADDNAPEKYRIKEIFRRDYYPTQKSSYFSSPIIEKPKITVNNNEICFSLCLIEYQNIRIYKHIDNDKILIYDSKNNLSNEFHDKDICSGNTYIYSYTPYLIINGKEIFGKEIFLEKIKTPTNNVGENWWIDE